MKRYDIYEHPKFGLETVQHGFSWVAFLAPSVWASTKGLGFITLMLVTLTTVAFNIATLTLRWYSGFGISPLLLLPGLLAILGMVVISKGHIWHANSLRKDGFEKQSSVVALNAKQAKKAFHHNSFDPSIAVAA